MDGEKVSICDMRMKGYLRGRPEWIDGLEIYNMENGEAVLSGQIVDQAACPPRRANLGLPLAAATGFGPDN